MGGTQSLNEIVAKLPNLKITSSPVNFNTATIVGGGGNEPEVVGSVYALTEGNIGNMTRPIEGKSGVYVFILDEITPAPETTDYTMDKSTLRMSRRGNADGAVIKALREKADVVDNRERIDIQGR